MDHESDYEKSNIDSSKPDIKNPTEKEPATNDALKNPANQEFSFNIKQQPKFRDENNDSINLSVGSTRRRR